MTGSRTEDHSEDVKKNTYDYNEEVEVLDEGSWVKGIATGFQHEGRKVVVMIGHLGHKNNGRYVTVDSSDVRPLKAEHPNAKAAGK